MLRDLRAYVAVSRAAQGLPPTITDKAALRRLATILARPQEEHRDAA